MTNRQHLMEYAENTVFDAVIIGGGINGACTYDALCKAGYKVLVVDKGDFAGATSQASGMMIWGGLLYLRNFDLKTVYKFSQARDFMIRTMGEHVTPSSYRYIPSARHKFKKIISLCGLYLYWMLGHFRRHIPIVEQDYDEKELLRSGLFNGSLLYEESMLRHSDSQFVWQWISKYQSENHVPLNYCEVLEGSFDKDSNIWKLNLFDHLSSNPFTVQTKLVINCAGVWTDTINDTFFVDTPYKHVFSKGVYIVTKRPKQHQSPLAFEMGQDGDTLTYVPWGPVSLWGPTETFIESIEQGFAVQVNDVHFLLEHMNYNLREKVDKSDIISVRCGVRPLVVRKDKQQAGYPLEISRRSCIVVAKNKNWLSVYGGKITGCTQVANKLVKKIKNLLPPTLNHQHMPAIIAPKETTFPGLSEMFPSIIWCMEHECCHTLEDYLRRRTNIAQWVTRGGLGESDENLVYLKELAMQLKHGNATEAEQELYRYRKSVEECFDSLMEAV